MQPQRQRADGLRAGALRFSPCPSRVVAPRNAGKRVPIAPAAWAAGQFLHLRNGVECWITELQFRASDALRPAVAQIIGSMRGRSV